MVLWSAATPFALVARTAIAPPPDLVSSFHPTYNLAVNLVRRWSREEAHELLAASYGQWQAPPGSESARRPVGPAPGHPGGARLHRRLAPDRGRPDPGLDLPRVGPAGGRGPPARGCSTGSSPALAGVASALTFEARRAGDVVAPRQAVVVRAPGPARCPGRPACGPTSAGWACGGPDGPTTAWPGPWWPGPTGRPWTRCCGRPRWLRGTSSATSASSSTWSASWPRWPGSPATREAAELAVATPPAGGGRSRRPGRRGVRARRPPSVVV